MRGAGRVCNANSLGGTINDSKHSTYNPGKRKDAKGYGMVLESQKDMDPELTRAANARIGTRDKGKAKETESRENGSSREKGEGGGKGTRRGPLQQARPQTLEQAAVQHADYNPISSPIESEPAISPRQGVDYVVSGTSGKESPLIPTQVPPDMMDRDITTGQASYRKELELAEKKKERESPLKNSNGRLTERGVEVLTKNLETVWEIQQKIGGRGTAGGRTPLAQGSRSNTSQHAHSNPNRIQITGKAPKVQYNGKWLDEKSQEDRQSIRSLYIRAEGEKKAGDSRLVEILAELQVAGISEARARHLEVGLGTRRDVSRLFVKIFQWRRRSSVAAKTFHWLRHTV
ncbi:hypothetical protein BGX38DRAFT_1228591 [Terfezia claveryi]|nr:hypothetical protein BGX38DRAFT_1228591 [Terfezia claveryi]